MTSVERKVRKGHRQRRGRKLRSDRKKVREEGEKGRAESTRDVDEKMENV